MARPSAKNLRSATAHRTLPSAHRALRLPTKTQLFVDQWLSTEKLKPRKTWLEKLKKLARWQKAWESTAKMHNTRWTPDEFAKELCCLAEEHHKKEKMVALAKEFIDICADHNYMNKISLLLLGLAKDLKDVNSLSELLAYCGKLDLRDRLQVKINNFVDTFDDRPTKKTQVCTLDHLWYNLKGYDLEPIHGVAVHPKSLVEREKLLRYINSNWPTAARSGFQTFCDRFPKISDRPLLKFLYCKYYCNRIRPKSIIIYFDTTRCTYKKALGFNYRHISNCGKYVIYQRCRLKKNSYFELSHNNQVSLLSEEDRSSLDL